jgi:hypothetical protein
MVEVEELYAKKPRLAAAAGLLACDDFIICGATGQLGELRKLAWAETTRTA